MGDFAYVVPPLPSDEKTYLCVDLAIPTGWVNTPPLFCAASDTETYLENLYIADPSSSFTKYGPTSNSYSTFPSHKNSPTCLQGADVYMDNLMCVSQGDPAH